MRLHRLFNLWCLATLLSISAAEPSVEATPSNPSSVSLVAGPWMLFGEDGALRCGIEIIGTLEATAAHLEQGGKRIDATIAVRPLRVASRPAGAVVEAVLPRDAAGEWALVIPGRRLVIHPRSMPAAGEAARVAFASVANWPRPQDLARLGERMGGPVGLVIAYGMQSAAHMGMAGWEADVPMVVLPEALPAGMREIEQMEAVAQARLGPLAVQWMAGTRWGCLGLPWTTSPTTAARIVAREISTWEVCLAPTSWWELGLLAPRLHRDATSTAPLIALCQHLRVPLILTLGGGAGWVSEPLLIDQEQTRVAPGGTRVIAATPAGDGLALLPPAITEVIDEPGIIALAADHERLRVVGSGFSGRDLLALDIRRDGNGFTGDGVGRITVGDDEVVSLRAQAVVADDAGAAARAKCRWLTARTLGMLHVEGPDVLALLGIAEAPGTVTFLRDLARVDEVANNAFNEHLGKLPAQVLRDLMLRQIARHGTFDQSQWAPVIAATNDPLMLAAILRAHQDGVDPGMLDLLVGRVRAQALGTTPIEGDALLQHRLMSAVFDSTSVSPTILRPLAVALRPKLSPFTVGPVERFIARHGEVRK